MNEPLAIKLRPKNLDEVLGQEHLICEGGPIRNFVNNKRIFSKVNIPLMRLMDFFNDFIWSTWDWKDFYSHSNMF